MIRRVIAALPVLVLAALPAAAQNVPTPREHFGFEIGEDRKLANWDQLTAYYERLAESSPRVKVDTLGSTTDGRPFVQLTISSERNLERLDSLRMFQLANIYGSPEMSRVAYDRIVDEGRAIVMITHGIHATEVGGSQTAARLAYKLASSDDPEILHILDEVVLLQIPSLNPDGLQWVANWYNEWVGTEYEAAPLPWLYHFYVGHDNNRDWYAFTQDETILTVRAQNRWHPHIVHDIHQMGGSGARIFFPPYINPWEPNIDPALTTAVNQLGMYMAAEVTKQGKPGVVVNAQYDAYTPARAYMHYHGGARILSETASARMATPVQVDPERLTGPRRGFVADMPSWNYPQPYRGGEWGLPDIVSYMEAGALALLSNAAKNRRFWIENQRGIVDRAKAGWDSWPAAWVIPGGQGNKTGLAYALRTLTMGAVVVERTDEAFTADGIDFPAGSYVIRMNQPWAGFAQTMLEVQHYPDLREYPGGPPQRPYDVTGHTLGYLMDFEAVAVEEMPDVSTQEVQPIQGFDFELPDHLAGDDAPRVAIYKSWQEPMEAGWTRWLFDEYGVKYDTLHDADIRRGGLVDRYDVLVMQAQSPQSIRDGYPEGRVPPTYAGGLGAQGVAAIEDFVRRGGRLVTIEESVDFAVELFDLDVRSATTGLSNTDFYIPGSILRLELDPASSLTRGMDADGVAWYWRSSTAFVVGDPSIRVAARYGSGDPLLSGGVLGGEQVAGKPALLEVDVGEGTVVMFGFQPNYRAQTVASWPLLFNALDR